MTLSRTTRLLTRLIAAGVGTASVLALSVVPAHAEKHERTDVTGDVTEQSGAMSNEGIRRATDIVKVRANHKDDVIRVVAWVDDLSRADQLQVVGRIRTAEGEVFQLSGRRLSPLRRGGLPPQRNNYFEVRSEETGFVACDGVIGSFVNKQDRVWLRAPRSCFGDPESIQYGVGTSGTSFDFWDLSGRSFGILLPYVTDDARRNGSGPARPEDIKIGSQVLAAG